MRLRAALRLGWVAFGLIVGSVCAADSALQGAWAAILRGDFGSARNSVSRLVEAGTDSSQATQIENWLDEYNKRMAERDELRRQTFEWNMTHAREALAQDKPYLALTFALQASMYAADKPAFSADPWIQELTQRCKIIAMEHSNKDEWSKALTYYSLLYRIHEHDEGIKALREEAARHARIGLTYKDKEALQKRIKGVEPALVSQVFGNVQRMYVSEPDLRKMADGALTSLEALAETTKLLGFLDGVANPALRAHFLARIAELRRSVKAAERFTGPALRKLYQEVSQLNEGSIELPEGLLVVEFVEGALEQLDEYSSMIWPADSQDFQKAMEGRFFGVGIQLGVDERTNRLKVVTPLESSPALEAGVEPDDLIIGVNGESTKGWTTDKAVANITGPAGTLVTLTLFRPATGQELSVPLKRRQIDLRTVYGVSRLEGDPDNWNYMLNANEGIAYIRLSQFHPESHEELLRALETAKRQGMRGLILDLRMNPGGLLEVAVETVSLFVKRGRVVSTRGRMDTEDELPVTGSARFADLPLIVLTDAASASASEILSGALQDHNRALVLGEQTFGKGSVQRVIPLTNNAKMKLTTALYYLPSGRSPHKSEDAKSWGVKPDLEVKLMPKEVRKLIDRQRASYVIHRTKLPPEPATISPDKASQLKDEDSDKDRNEDLLYLSDEEIKLLDSDPHKASDYDPQLETALLQMRVKLASELPWPRQVVAKDR